MEATIDTRFTSAKEVMFKVEALRFIGNIVHARQYCMHKQIGKCIPEETTKPVVSMYYNYKRSWRGISIAKFLVKYQTNLIEMSTGGAKQAEKLRALINKSIELYGQI